MRKLILLLLCLLPLLAHAEILQPVHWQGEPFGDSVRITATIDEGWYLSVMQLAGEDVEDETEYRHTAVFVVPAHTPQIKSHACNDETCLAPEVWEYQSSAPTAAGSQKSSLEWGASQQSDSDRGLLWIFLLGLLGGLLAIFTPCVWPIIPMTVSFFLKRTDNGVKNAVLYGLSIIVLYVGLGLLVTILFGASALNELSTNAVVNLFFFALLVVFALSFFGLFEITLPDSWSTAIDSKARSTGGLLSILLMAFTLVIVSFSCTGPIIGTLLVEAAGRSLLAPAIGMLGFAIALALPFSLFAMFPQWMKQAPKSGDWMTAFKVVLAFLELALSLKFLSVADLAYGWGYCRAGCSSLYG